MNGNPEPFPPAILGRLRRIPSLDVELDHSEPALKVTWRAGLPSRSDRRELSWVLGSRAWPAGWMWDLREVGAFA